MATLIKCDKCGDIGEHNTFKCYPYSVTSLNDNKSINLDICDDCNKNFFDLLTKPNEYKKTKRLENKHRPYTKEEDQEILDTIAKYTDNAGRVNWASVRKRLKGRTLKAFQGRYYNLIKKLSNNAPHFS